MKIPGGAEIARLGQFAAGVIVAAVNDRPQPGADSYAVDDFARQPGASFVTLRRGEALRGCIGSIAAYRELREDVAENARSAAFDDPRFEPLGTSELAFTSVEVSVLTPSESLTVNSDDELEAVLRPGIDGLIVRYGIKRATYLPSVWKQFHSSREFVMQLRNKAGIPMEVPLTALHFERYAAVHSEPVDLIPL